MLANNTDKKLERNEKQCNKCKWKNLNYAIYYTTCIDFKWIVVILAIKLIAMRFYLSYIVDMHGDYAMVQVDVDHAIGDNSIHGLLDHIVDM
jgi:hypothetical protein